MLTVQPKFLSNYKPAFKSNEIRNQNFDLSEMDEDSYESARDELLDTKNELEDLANNDEFKLPKGVNKAIKVGTSAATIGVAAMAGGFGAGKVFSGMEKLFNTKFMKSVTKKIGTISKLKNWAPLKKVTTAITEAYNKFGTTKYGKPVVNVLNKIGKGIMDLYNKIRGVKTETYRKVSVNTVGASSGIATGVNMLREKSEAEVGEN